MEEMVVEALLCGDEEARVLAARELSRLTSKQRQQLAERGVIKPLIFMLHMEDDKAIEAALFALLSLAFGSERNKVRIVKYGAISALQKILQSQNESLVEPAIAALLILSSCSANKLTIAASGAIQLLVETLNLSSADSNSSSNTSMQTKFDIISTLHNLSTCHQVIPSLVLCGVVVSLLQLICSSEISCELVEKTMALLEKIISSSDTALEEIVGTNGAIQLLIEAMEEGSTQCKEHAVGILFLICQSCRDKYREMILKEGVMPGLLQLSVDGTWRIKEKAKALLLLLRDSPGCGSRDKNLKNVLLEQVMREIDREEKTGTALSLVEVMISRLKT